jgi:hypothetical protein
MMEPISGITPRTLVRDPLLELSPGILGKKGTIQMATQENLISRTELLQHPMQFT